MPCYHPLTAYPARDPDAVTGKRRMVFNPLQGHPALPPQKLPCRQCIGCRLERSRQWAVRCMHEASLHDQNCFITLTYRDLDLPPGGSLRLRDYQLFMKRLRKSSGHKIRFFHCGEYGDKLLRPHYHACLFGHDFRDKEPWKKINDNQLYTSETLSTLWPSGFSSLGAVTFDSAAYVARYIMKKITGDMAFQHYCEMDPETGEIIIERQPEYTTMSRRPGLGQGWLDKYQSDVYPSDEVIVNNGHPSRPPRYYDNQYEITNPEDLQKIKQSRVKNAKQHADDNTPDRLRVREQVKHAQIGQLVRTLKENP